MPRKNGVLSCESNAGALGASKATTFSFPKNEKTKKLWIRSINSEDLVPSSNSTVCISHIRKNLIINGKRKPKLASNAQPSVSSKGFCCQNPGENKNISHVGGEQLYEVGGGSGWSSTRDKFGVPNRTDQIIFSENTEISQGCSTLVGYDGSREAVACHLRALASSPVHLVATSYPVPLQTPLPPQLLSPLPEQNTENSATAMAACDRIVTTHLVQEMNDDSMNYIIPSSDGAEQYTLQEVIESEPVLRIDEEPIEEEMKVIDSCCVFGCFSNLRAPLVTMFPFPDDESQRKLWLKCIHREDYVPTRFSAVCIHHFREEFIVRTIGSRRRNGSVVILPLDKPNLAPGAFPSLFIKRSRKMLCGARPPPVLQRRIECPARESRELGLHEEYMVKEESDIQEAWLNSVEEEKEVDKQWFRNKSDVNIFLSPTTVKEEYDDEELIVC